MLRVFSLARTTNVARIDTWVRSLDGPKLLNRAGLLALRVEGESFHITGPSPASFPVFGRALFAGIQDVVGESRAESDTLRLWQTPDLSVGDEWQFVARVVVGWQVPRAAAYLPGESPTREAFLHYLDTIRVKPTDINLHSDSWWTLPLPFSEVDVVSDIEALRRGFYERTGMFFDTYALDLGWSDPRTFWGIDTRNFPNGLGRIQSRLADLQCRMGMWVSPSSGYPPGLDNRCLEAQGYEMTPVGPDGDKDACFAIGGRYQREFSDMIAGYAKDYSLGHVIFDGLNHRCDDPSHLHATGVGSTYSIAAGFKEVMDRLRLHNPDIILEPLSCGHPPSPWWNMHTPYLLGPAGDDVPYGRVPSPDWNRVADLGARHRVSRGAGAVAGPHAGAGDLRHHRAVARRVREHGSHAAGRGRWFMSANIRPELMEPTDWDFLAGLVRWQRHNKQHLVDAKMFGGNAADREAYGYVFHNVDRAIYCIRNPWMEERTIKLPARVPDVRDLRMVYPRRALVGQLQPNEDGPTIVLGPYETMFLETFPATDGNVPIADAPVRAELVAGDPEVSVTEQPGAAPRLRYRWSGSLTVPAVSAAELCVLVEGTPDVEAATATIRVNGVAAAPVKTGSAGWFGAAASPSPENWTWFIVPLTPGTRDIQIELEAPLAKAGVGVFLRATVPATSDDAPDEPVPFPLYQPNQRQWSQALEPVKRFGRGAEVSPDQ